MFKVKLLILLLISFLNSCSTSQIKKKHSFNIDYIGGAEDGLIFSNLLISNLSDYGLYNPGSRLVIYATITHEKDLYITNVDNTSNREKITSTLNVEIFDKLNECNVLNYRNSESQFYLIADTVNFTSNNVAVDQIKFRNDQDLIKKLIPQILTFDIECIDKLDE